MKSRISGAVTALSVGLLASGTCNIVLASSIANTPHNLGSGNNFTKTPSGNTPSNHSGNTAEICVFCHTPHGGDSSAAVPIWNRKLGMGGDPTSLQYKRYSSLGTVTFEAAEAPIGSVTIACLSCHDGTQAIDNVMNLPGSGGYNSTLGVRIGNFVGGDTSGNGKLGDPAKIVQNLSTDLSNDHPVSMQYGGGGISISEVAPLRTNDPDFHIPKNIAAPQTSTLQKLWYVESGTNSLNPAGRDREDVILYTRNELGTLQPFVECGSCHDPHNSENPTFLRISNSGSGVPGPSAPADVLGRTFPWANGGPSALCLTCHNK
jgi:hypothetical protein